MFQPPVLPSPTTLNQPIKRPGLGRPRGRPPGPKSLSGQSKSPRGRSPMAASSNQFWGSGMLDSKSTYDYLRQYQEHVIRQYNQTLTLTQMAQLISNQYTPTTSSASNMMNPSALLQSMQQLSTGLHSMSASQLNQSLSMLNPSLLKKLTEQMTLANLSNSSTTQIPQLTPEQIRQITALMQTTKPTSTKTSNLAPSGKVGKSSMTYTQASNSKTTTTGSYKNTSEVKTKTKETMKQTTYQPSKVIFTLFMIWNNIYLYVFFSF